MERYIASVCRDDRYSLIRLKEDTTHTSEQSTIFDTLDLSGIGASMILYSKTHTQSSLLFTVATAELDAILARLNRLLRPHFENGSLSLFIDSDISVITATEAAALDRRRLCDSVVNYLLLESIRIFGIASDDMRVAVIVKLADAERAVALLKKLVE